MARKFANNAFSLLAAGITDVAVSLTVTTGEGARFPALSGADDFTVTLTDGTNVEIVKVTARTTDSMTIVRAQEGTTARAWSAGAVVSGRLTAGTMQVWEESRQPLDATLTAIADGSLGALGHRNLIINGAGAINQRGAINLTSAPQYGPDRWLGAIASGTGITGTFSTNSFGGSSSGNGIYIINASFTNGQPYFAQRIEASNCNHLNSKTVTVSGKIVHDVGSSVDFVVRLQKANALDNFSTVTAIATSANIAVPNNTVTEFTVNFTLGASDATNGLMLDIFTPSALTVTSKNFAITDIQLEQGSEKTPFDKRQYGTELALCQRYYERSQYRLDFTGYSTNFGTAFFVYRTEKRATPTLSLVGNAETGCTYNSFTVNTTGSAAATFSPSGAGAALATGTLVSIAEL